MDDTVGELQTGSVFAGYRIERRLGTGGMGSVYLARHPNLPRFIALKLLDPSATANPGNRSRFLREADHVARLEHPNIVTVYDRGNGGDQLWIAMQYVDGTDAVGALRRGPMPPGRAVHIVSETARALDYAHAHGILHRDVKPANILLTPSGASEPERVLLADFGIAKSLDSTAVTETGMLVASLQYASPEQIEGRPLGPRTDVYALGCTLYQLLTTRPPYPGSEPAHLVHAHLHLPPPRPTAARPDLPSAFDDVIARAMAKRPEDRFPTCGALAAAARAALTEPVTEPVTAPTRAVTAAEPAPVSAGPTAPPGHPTSRSRRPLLVLLGAAVVGLALVGSLTWILPGRGEAPEPDVRADTSATGQIDSPGPVVPPPATVTAEVTDLPTTSSAPTSTAPPQSRPDRIPVAQADTRGFDDDIGPRCNSTDEAVAVARTSESRVLVCRNDFDRLYYKGLRLSDGADIELADAAPAAAGFTVVAGPVRYTFDEDELLIIDNGTVTTREQVLQFWSAYP
ncbi:serine/threonine protein kinase [Rhodococcus aetherivorans]|uniref:non-specific serine/threonine protein kinase n=1 Tax=Rhodococcus aetherivorans TaxID=191292 RepID=A0ABQ0YKZ9_9NOCA|nr:serine/threonine-protein kinase [Rhodococcus aetherivorans]ETT27599.1 serine/threonine protein kinase [Rhodococcus rhodochrous ATCC 21198]NGP26509.1 protein kinase [Rhodococcus aetherivorans]GES37247.1 serine/threonine protein kinase [Rhodococcus aetherivorans]